MPSREQIREVVMKEVYELNMNPEPLTRLIMAFRDKLNFVLSISGDRSRVGTSTSS